MSLRPQESIRKAIAAGYGNPPNVQATAGNDDGTIQLCKASADVELGDWVNASSGTDGHPNAAKPSGAGAAKTNVGVVLHKAASGEWVRVKTAGTALAKVDTSPAPSAGDRLHLESGSFSAKKGQGTYPCGRFLYRFGGDDRLAMVVIGAAAIDGDLLIDHHDDANNTMVRDTTTGTLTAPLWNIFRVVNLVFTGTEDPRLALAIGGGSSHGETPTEGYGWGGVIGAEAKMGYGEIGGNRFSGKQGVLGAENEGPTDEGEAAGYRLNVRSWAGFNARDRYGFAAPVVDPIRFTWCRNGSSAKNPLWVVPGGCDCMAGITAEPCPPKAEWWSGTMKLDKTVWPGPFTKTPWTAQWTPQFAIERDCCTTVYAPVVQPPYTCGLVTNPGRFEQNAYDVSGAYENLIPWGYVASPGRLSVLHAICCHGLHIQQIWRFLNSFASVVDRILACIDTQLIALGRPPCCAPGAKATVPAVSCGPGAKECVDLPTPPTTTPRTPGEITPTDPPGPNPVPLNPGVPPGH